jgi:hypothetical protein
MICNFMYLLVGRCKILRKLSVRISEMTFPVKDAKIELEVQAFPGHKRDAEAYLLIAWDSSVDIKNMELFPETEPMGISC